MGLLIVANNHASALEDGASSNITIITSEEIAREKPASVMDLLRRKVGVDSASSQISMRGAQGVVIVVDNVPTAAIPSTLKPEDVQKIEIIRGAASSRYGASAMGGAVVVTTKEGSSKLNVDVIQGYGSFDRRFTKVIGDAGLDGWNFRMAGERNVNRNMLEVVSADTPFSYLVHVEPEYSKTDFINARIGKKGKRLDADFDLKYSESFNSYGRPNWWSELKNIKLRGSLKYMPLDWLEISPIISYANMLSYEGMRDKGTGTDAEGLAPDRKSSGPYKTQSVEIQTVAKKSQTSRLTLGLKASLDEETTSVRDYHTDDIRFEYRYKNSQKAAFFLLETALFEAVSMDISARYDEFRYHDVYINDTMSQIYGGSMLKESVNPKVGFKWKASDKTAFRWTVGTGFMPPSPFNLYYSDTSSPSNRVLNNPDLKPETTLTTDIGVDISLPRGLNVSVTPFYTLWKDKVDIVYTVDGDSATQQPRNIGESVSRGVELQISGQFNDEWSAFFNYTHSATEITKNESDSSVVGNEVPNMPRNKFNLGLAFGGKDDFHLKMVWRYVGSRFLDQRNTIRDGNGCYWKRDAYSTLDAVLVKRVRLKWLSIDDLEITFAADNIFDERYGEWFFYKNTGRAIRGEVAARF